MFGTSTSSIYLLGDSITQQGYNSSLSGWVASLSNDYIRKLTVINSGLSGYSTDKALSVLPQIIPSPEQARIRLFVVFLGANDARLPDTPGVPQHIPLNLYKENLREIVNHQAVQAHKPHVLLITPPPIDERLCEEKDREKGIMQPCRIAKVTSTYAQAVRDVSKELGVEVLDIHHAFLSAAGWTPGHPLLGSKEVESRDLAKFLRDGLHLTALGNRLLYEEFKSKVVKTWPELNPETMGFVLPYWADEGAWKHLEGQQRDAVEGEKAEL
jgi:isoamyl acetate esterase